MKRSLYVCSHYRATSEHTTCKAGIPYETFMGTHPRIMSWPCFWRQSQPQPCSCPSARYQTPEEIAAEDAEFQERFQKIDLAREAIVKACGGPWAKGDRYEKTGLINCPVCHRLETLQYSRSGYNGHIHAKCSTPGCVSWME